MLRNIGKFLLGGIGIVAFGVGALFLIDYVRYQRSPEFRAMKEVEKIKEEIAADPYGGDTPEETLRLFVEALKKGDTELAAKYFVYDKQVEWREDLAIAADKNLLNTMIDEAQLLKLSKKDERRAFFTLANENNIVEVQVILVKAPNGKWKIQDL